MGALVSCCVSGKEDFGYGESNGKDVNGKERKVLVPPGRSQPKAIIIHKPAFQEGDFHKKYDLQAMLGTGSTCVCHMCVNRTTNVPFACKIVDKRGSSTDSLETIDTITFEIQVLQSLQHPNIVHVEDVFQTESKIYMVTELLRGGELFDYVVERGTLSELEASKFVHNVTSALAYMHENGIIHRDLKPENLLLTSKSPDARVKIIDFGTRGYLAPEMLRRESYNKAVDVWALGVIVYVLLCGCLPFDDDGSKIPSKEAAKKKFHLRFPPWASGLSSGAKNLLQNLLQVDETKRFTADEALRHAWVSGTNVPNKFLESPKHLRDIRPTPKRKQVKIPDDDEEDTTRVRRQSR